MLLLLEFDEIAAVSGEDAMKPFHNIELLR